MCNEILLYEGNDVALAEVVARIAMHCGSAPLADLHHPIFRVFMVAHWSLAEMQTFKHFREIKVLFDSVRGTYITMGAPYEVCTTLVEQETHRYVDVEVILCDTALLAPAGHQTLASLGKVIGLPKLDVGGYKERMGALSKTRNSLTSTPSLGDCAVILDCNSCYSTRGLRG